MDPSRQTGIFDFARRPVRERYWPRSPAGQAFLSAVPWVNLVLVVLLVVELSRRILVLPGTLFELPEAPFNEGMRQGSVMLMMPVERAGGDETLVFFDDDRYASGDGEQMARLAARVRSVVGPEREVNLLIDRRVSHGEVMSMVHRLREAGIGRVNVVEKPR